MRSPSLQFLALAGAVALAGCSDSDTGDVRLQLATRPLTMAGGAPAAAATAGELTVTLGSDEIVLDGVQLVLRQIRLDGAATADCPEEGDVGVECGQLQRGPAIFDLPLDLLADPVFTTAVPVGSYRGVKIQIHKLSNANEDADLVAEHPEFAGISIRATGTYNGTPFTFASDLTEVQHLNFENVVEVEAGGVLGLTLHADVSGWFANGGGTGLIDPAQANDGGPFESEVERNIRESFRSYQDGDADGLGDS